MSKTDKWKESIAVISSPKGFSVTGIGCLWKWLRHHPWRCLREVQIWQLGPWLSGGHVSVRLMVRLDFKAVFQPHWFYDSMHWIFWKAIGGGVNFSLSLTLMIECYLFKIIFHISKMFFHKQRTGKGVGLS